MMCDGVQNDVDDEYFAAALEGRPVDAVLLVERMDSFRVEDIDKRVRGFVDSPRGCMHWLRQLHWPGPYVAHRSMSGEWRCTWGIQSPLHPCSAFLTA
jgi:hypothetical protein